MSLAQVDRPTGCVIEAKLAFAAMQAEAVSASIHQRISTYQSTSAYLRTSALPGLSALPESESTTSTGHRARTRVYKYVRVYVRVKQTKCVRLLKVRTDVSRIVRVHRSRREKF